MMVVWAEDEDIVCVHLAGGRLGGQDEVRESWARIFAAGPRARDDRAASDAHRHDARGPQCVERFVIPQIKPEAQPAPIVATNVYRRPPRLADDRAPRSSAPPQCAGRQTAPSARGRGRRSCTRCFRSPWWLPGGHLQTIYASLPPRRRACRSSAAAGDARRRLRRRRLRRRRRGAPAPRAFPWSRGLLGQPLRARQSPHAAAGVARRDPALARLLRRAEPRAAGLPLGRQRRGRLANQEIQRRQRGDRHLARRQRAPQMAGRARRGGEGARRRARRCRHRSTCPRRARRSTTA